MRTSKNYNTIRNGYSIFIRKIHDYNSWAKIVILAQPIFNPNTSNIEYYELMSRVDSQSGEDSSNIDFFSTISDELVIAIAESQISYIKEVEFKFKMAVNLTVDCLYNKDFFEFLLREATKDIVLEFNDFHYINGEKLRFISNKIRTLSNKGYRLCLDAFHHKNTDSAATIGVIDWDYIKLDASYLYYNSQDMSSMKSLVNVLNNNVKNNIIMNDVNLDFHENFCKKQNLLYQGYKFSPPEVMEDIAVKFMRNTYNDKSKKDFNSTEMYRFNTIS